MPSFIARYHELTKYDPRSIDRLGTVLWQEQPQPFKDIAGEESIDLKPHLPFLSQARPGDWAKAGLRPGPPFDVSSVARLSWFSAGINAMVHGTNPPLYLRATPSAGGLYPIELYWAIFDVPGIDPGIYLFHPVHLSLVPVWRGSFRPDIQTAFGNHSAFGTCPAAAVLTGIFGRGAWRYKERAYRRMLLDAGHLSGNLHLLAREEGIHALSVSGFHDQGLSDLLFLDKEEEVPLLAIAMSDSIHAGEPRSGRSPTPSEERSRVPPDASFQVHAHRLAELPSSSFDWVPRESHPQPSPSPDLLLANRPSPLRSSLHPVLATRRSAREYGSRKVPWHLFRRILGWSFSAMEGTLGEALLPGAITTRLAIHGVEGIQSGLWQMDRAGSSLHRLRPGDLREECAAACLGQDLASDSGATLFHTVDLDSVVERCGERSYRDLCIDAGHAAQRLALACHAVGLGFSGIGGYFDDEVNRLLGVPASEAILYVTTLGTLE
ncbi:MAG: SagB family peptide dehydrogenase [Fibrobacteria bacterium]|nr:SagB family peptide dehydrogenase [Fibrobacteria bacterium]